MNFEKKKYNELEIDVLPLDAADVLTESTEKDPYDSNEWWN